MPRVPRPQPKASSHADADVAVDWLALDRQLCFALYAASHTMTKTYRPLLAPLGLTYPQYLVMLVLWGEDGLGVSQTGERLGLDSATLTPLLKRLEAAGLLQRLRDSGDERRLRLRLTPAGRALRRRAAAIPTRIAAASGCGPAEIGALTQRLHALRRQLDAATDSLAAGGHPHT